MENHSPFNLCFIIYSSPASYLSVISVGYCFVACLVGVTMPCLLGWSYDAVAVTIFFYEEPKIGYFKKLLRRKKRKEATLEEKST
jgi:hypothetical protein